MIIWFNHNFSSTAQVIRSLKREGEYRLVASHQRADALMFQEADLALTEPDRVDDAAYLEWALSVCQRHQVDVFIPERRKLELSRCRGRFEAVGTRLLIVARPEVLELAEDKAALYAALGTAGPPNLVPIPPHCVVRTAAQLDEALDALNYTEAELTLCVKPVQGLFGTGFRTLGEVSLAHLLGGSSRLSPSHLRVLMSEAEASGETRPLLVMRYLSGAERSVDCLAHGGELVQCVVRRKGAGPSQLLEDNPAVQEMAAALTRALELTGVYNVQFKDDAAGTPYLLEINTRASGGLPMAMLSGLNFYHWAIQLMAGRCSPADVPPPRTGLRVAMGGAALALSEARDALIHE